MNVIENLKIHGSGTSVLNKEMSSLLKSPIKGAQQQQQFMPISDSMHKKNAISN